jgi:uncharacterized protein YlaN (UPF0358 family)
MTNPERTKILEMVAEGSLTIEQADQLLERLSAQSQASATPRPDQGQNASGFPTFTREQMAALEAYEVDADYIRALQEAGLQDLTVKQLIALKNHEIDAEYVKALMDLDLTGLTVKQLIALKDYEVDADDIVALREAGLTNLTVEQLISLKERGE